MRIGINQFCFPAPCDVREALERAKALGYDCVEICLTADKQENLRAGGVTDALDISGYFNRLLHENAGEKQFRELRAMVDEVGIPLCSVGGIVSFFLNKHFTFRSREKGAKVVFRFVVNISVCYLLAYGLAKPAVSWLLGGMGLNQQLQGNLTMLAGSGLFVILNYFGQRFFAFKPS